MKTKSISNTIAATCFAFLAAATVSAQDTVRVNTIDSVRIREVVRDTVRVAQPVVHDTVHVVQAQATPPAPPVKDERPPLRRGEFGLRFLPTFTSLAFNTSTGGTVNGDMTLSYGYGIMLGLNLSRYVGLQVEANYNDIAQKYKDQNLNREVHINYVNIPVLLSISTDKSRFVNLNIVAGPQFGINVGSSISANNNGSTDNVHAVLAVKSNDIGLAYGAGLDFILNKARTVRFDIGFRGMYGLVNIDGSKPAGADSYNVLVSAARKMYSGYAGITFLF